MKKLSNCLNDNLNKLIDKVGQVKQINDILHSHLPQHLRADCSASQFNQGILTLSLSNQSIATELRYLIPDLRNKLRQNERLYGLNTIKISTKEAPLTKTNKDKDKKVASTSKAANILREHSSDFDDAMSLALENLANSIEGRNAK